MNDRRGIAATLFTIRIDGQLAQFSKYFATSRSEIVKQCASWVGGKRPLCNDAENPCKDESTTKAAQLKTQPLKRQALAK